MSGQFAAGDVFQPNSQVSGHLSLAVFAAAQVPNAGSGLMGHMSDMRDPVFDEVVIKVHRHKI